MTTIVATQGTNEFPKVPTGVHNARCVRVIDLGTQRIGGKFDTIYPKLFSSTIANTTPGIGATQPTRKK